MAGKVRVNGTNYSITGGKCRVNGTNYAIKKGRALVGGTNYDISFGEPVTFTVDIWNPNHTPASADLFINGVRKDSITVLEGYENTVEQYDAYMGDEIEITFTDYNSYVEFNSFSGFTSYSWMNDQQITGTLSEDNAKAYFSVY